MALSFDLERQQSSDSAAQMLVRQRLLSHGLAEMAAVEERGDRRARFERRQAQRDALGDQLAQKAEAAAAVGAVAEAAEAMDAEAAAVRIALSERARQMLLRQHQDRMAAVDARIGRTTAWAANDGGVGGRDGGDGGNGEKDSAGGASVLRPSGGYKRGAHPWRLHSAIGPSVAAPFLSPPATPVATAHAHRVAGHATADLGCRFSEGTSGQHLWHSGVSILQLKMALRTACVPVPPSDEPAVRPRV